MVWYERRRDGAGLELERSWQPGLCSEPAPLRGAVGSTAGTASARAAKAD